MKDDEAAAGQFGQLSGQKVLYISYVPLQIKSYFVGYCLRCLAGTVHISFKRRICLCE